MLWYTMSLEERGIPKNNIAFHLRVHSAGRSGGLVIHSNTTIKRCLYSIPTWIDHLR